MDLASALRGPLPGVSPFRTAKRPEPLARHIVYGVWVGARWGMVAVQADEEGRYTAGSMYRAWKGRGFADKKRPSAWLTFLVLRLQKHVGMLNS